MSEAAAKFLAAARQVTADAERLAAAGDMVGSLAAALVAAELLRGVRALEDMELAGAPQAGAP